MLLAIISDTHDNLANLDKFLVFAKKTGIGALIHCGDVAAAQTLEYMARRFPGPIFVSEGNMDQDYKLRDSAKISGRISYFQEFGSAPIGGLNIGFCHHKETAISFCKDAKKGCVRFPGKKFDFVFYGHTHKPWLETINGAILANPGNLAGILYKSTFAVLDTGTKKLDLKITGSLKI